MGHHDVRGFLQRIAVLVLKHAAVAGFEQPIRLPQEALSVVGRNGLAGVDQLVDPRRQDRERSQPGEVFVVEEQVQKVARSDAPVAVFVRATLPVQEERVQPNETGTEITQPLTSVVHYSGCTPGRCGRKD